MKKKINLVTKNIYAILYLYINVVLFKYLMNLYNYI